jgi:predicted DCC family thiol-disulfide oxidoreductase YuxK
MSRSMATLVFYDGLCGLCDRFVRFLVSRDAEGRLRFAPLQGDVARRTLVARGCDPADLDTVYVVADWNTPHERVLERSTAVLHALGQLGRPWSALAAVGRRVPRPLADALYRFTARNRYRLFGRFDTCPLPPQEWQDRFVTRSV